jgi:DNA-binding NtrC family response regulator
MAKKQIMLVDDDRTNVRLMKMLLEMDGFKITTSHNVTHAKSEMFSDLDALVVDYHLADDEQGIDLLLAVRQGNTAVPQDIVVIITTGDHRQAQVALDAGANRFMLKPYPPSELSQELSKLLKKEA